MGMRGTPGNSAGALTVTSTPSPASTRAPSRSGAGRAERAAFATAPPTYAARAPARAALPALHRAHPATASWPTRRARPTRIGTTATSSTDAWPAEVDGRGGVLARAFAAMPRRYVG